MSQVFDPYSVWLDIPPRDHPPDHYALLGLRPFEPDQRVIREASRERADWLRRHRAGEHAEVCERILHDLSAATECLLDPGKKSDYDKSLREAQKMDDTRSMSGANLEVEAKGAEPKPLRWGGAAKKESTATTPHPPSGGAERDEPEADSQSSFGSDSSSGGSSGGLAALESAAEHHRQPLINVVVISSGVGILLVAALGLFIGILATGRTNSADDDQPGTPSSVTLAGDKQMAGNDGNPQDAGSTKPPITTESPIDSTSATSDETAENNRPEPSTSPDEATIGDLPASINASAEEPETVARDVTSTPPTPARPPIPSLEEHERLLAQVEAEFGVDQLVTRSEILDLAERLIERTGESAQSAERQFGLLLMAARLASQSGDPVLAMAAVDEIRSAFETVDSQIEELLAGVLGDRLDEGRQRWQRIIKAKEVLAADPADPPANLEIGRYYCFLRDDWPRGLPHLAGGENTALRLLAESELAETATWQQRLALGDGWWAVSLVAGAEDKTAERERAARWYRLALPDLEGSAKRRAQSRIASLIALPEDIAPVNSGEETNREPPAEAEGGARESTAIDVEQPIDLSGTWRSDRFDSVFRLDDRGSTVRCEVVSSKMVGHVDGLWIRDKGQLLCDRWRFRFVDDPAADRSWDLGCEPKVVDEKTILIRAEVVEWDRRGREADRRWETATWKREG